MKVWPRNEALDCRVLNVAALGVLLSMGLDLSPEAERLSSLVHAVAVGERSTTEAHAPRRRAPSAELSIGDVM